MKKILPNRWTRLSAAALLVIHFIGITPTALFAAEIPTNDAVPGELLVKFHRSLSDAEQQSILSSVTATFSPLHRAHRGRGRLLGKAVSTETPAIGDKIVRVHLKKGIRSEDAARELLASGDVAYVEPNHIFHAADTVPNDTDFAGKLWGLNNTGQTGGTAGADIKAEKAWDVTTGSNQVIVAVVDSGIKYDHPDIAANMWKNPGEIAGNGVDDDNNGYVDDVYGYNFVDRTGDPNDDYFHGTHVAGIIGAVGNNATGVTGVCWTVKLMALKVLDFTGSGNVANAVEAIDYAVANGATVINLSWGGTGINDQTLQDAITQARSAGVIVIAAAGNNNNSTPFYPAAFSNVVAVAGTDASDQKYSLSNFGSYIAIAAPADSIWSTNNSDVNPYRSASGTSMACAYVSGVAALLKSVEPTFTPSQIESRLESTADDLGAPGRDNTFGWGRVNAFQAVRDTTTPTLSITSPANGATVAGTINVSATATDNRAIANVKFYVNNVLQGTDNQSANPHIFSWNTTPLPNQSYALKMVATDTSGNTNSATISVTVKNTTPPSVSITTPANGATISGTTAITATATPNVTGNTIAKVDFYQGTTLLGTSTASPYSYSWDTTAVANGAYVLIAKATDSDGNVGGSTPVNVTVTNTASPTVSITAPANGATISGTTAITATATPKVTGATIVKVDFYQGTTLLGTSTTSPYSYSWDTTAVANGAYILVAKATDSNGNIGSSPAVNVTVTNLASPTVSITAPANGATISGTTAITATATPKVTGATIAKVDFYQGTTLLGTSTTSPYSYSWDTTAAANGAYVLVAKATDSNGNIGSSPAVNVTVTNTAPPVVSITAPANGATISGTTAITATATPKVTGATIAKVDFYQGTTLLGTSTTSPYSYSWDTTAGANGAYVLVAKATDSGGNVGTSSVVNVTVTNTTPPVVSITAPVNGATISGTTAITATATPKVTGATIAKVDFYQGSGLLGTSTASPYSYSWNTAALANGAYVLSAKATDSNGNAGSSSNVTVVVANDHTPPTVAITNPANNESVSGEIGVSVNATDNVRLARLDFLVDGTLLTTLNLPDGSAATGNSSYSFSWDSTGAAAGDHLLQVKGTDASNNFSIASVHVTLELPAAAPPAQFRNIFNPAKNEQAIIPYSLSSGGNVSIKIYDLLGNESRNLLDAQRAPGSYSEPWDGRNNGSEVVASGVYIAAINADGHRQTRKMVVIK